VRLPATVLTYVLAAGLLSLTFPVALAVFAVTWPFDRHRLATSRAVRWLGEVLLRSAPLWSVEIEGAYPPPPAAFVVVPNHQSMIDALAVACLPREAKWIGKASVFRFPWIGWAFTLCGHVPVDRDDRASGAAARARLLRYVEAGIPVGLFAEGTRSRDGTLRPFRAGPFKTALEAGVPVVPVAISGAGRAMAPDQPLLRPARIRVRILPAIVTAGRSVEDVDALREETRRAIAGALEDLERSG
jgi:1-acyl-sn-glycerol-3-phosphate acyltransferase